MKKDEPKLYLTVFSLFIFLLSIPIVYYATYIIVDIAKIYSIKEIANFGFVKIVGLIYIWNILKLKGDWDKQWNEANKRTQKESIKRVLFLTGWQIFAVSLIWSFAYIAHYFIK